MRARCVRSVVLLSHYSPTGDGFGCALRASGSSNPEEIVMQQKQFFYIFLGFLVSFHVVCSALCVATPTPSFLINELQRFEKNMDGISADFHCTTRLGTGPGIDYPGSFKYGNGNHWRIRRDPNTPDSAWTELSYVGGQHELTLTKQKNNHIPALSATSKGDGFQPVQNGLAFYPLFGYVEGNDQIVLIRELLGRMTLSVGSTGSHQNETIVLNGKNNEAEISIEFSQKGYYVPIRILLTPINHPFLIRCEYLLDDFQMIGDVPFPHKITSSREQYILVPFWGGKDGRVEQRRIKDIPRELADKSMIPKNFDWSKAHEDNLLTTAVYTFSDVRVKQSFSLEDFAITTDLREREGRNIIVKNARHLPHELIEGKPVPLYDPTILEAKGLSFLGSPSSPRFWFNMLGFLIILTALGHMVYKYFKNRREATE